MEREGERERRRREGGREERTFIIFLGVPMVNFTYHNTKYTLNKKNNYYKIEEEYVVI